VASVAQIEKKIADAKLTIKQSDDKLKRLRDQLRVYSGAKKLSDAQIKAAQALNKQIKDQEAAKSKASQDLDKYNKSIGDLKKLEGVDAKLKAEIASYNKALALGGKPNKSKINALLSERKNYEKTLGTLAPKAPFIPSAVASNAANAPTGTTAAKPPAATKTPAGASGTVTPAGTKGAATATPASAGTAGTAGAAGTATAGAAGTDGEKTDTTAAGAKDERTKDQRYADAIADATRLYNMPDIIFKNIGSLGTLLQKYVDNKLTDKQFQMELANDPWVRQNSQEIKARYLQLFNYQDLVKSGRALGTTDYEQQITRITRTLQERARQLTGADIPEADAKLMAQDLYIFNLDGDEAVVTERLARFIRPTAGMVAGKVTEGYGGQALQNYQALQAIAKANGFKIEDILPRDAAGNAMTAESTLQAIATNKIDTNRLAQDVRKLAAQGQPEYVRQLLGQGYDLEQIYSPYKNRMASILEVNPDTIDLNDPALRMAIGKNGDMNLYDFEKALRKDNRWQYTQNARQEVAGSVLQVLRDFGFAG
jgi:hypothetical protein